MTEAALQRWQNPDKPEESGASEPLEVEEKAAETSIADEEPEPAEEKAVKPGGKLKTKEDTAKRMADLLAEINTLKAEKRESEKKPEVPVESPKTEPVEASSLKEPDEPPSLEEFEGTLKEWEKLNRAYLKDLAKYLVDKSKEESKAERQQESAKATTEAETKRLKDIWFKKVDLAKESYPDYESVAFNAEIPISAAMDAFIIDPENDGAKLLYLLGQDLEEAKRIFKLSPNAATKALVKLEASIEAETEESKPEPTRKPINISKASRPATDIPRASGLPKDPSLEAVKANDFGAFRAAEQAKAQARRRA
jgi:hypothetical protein